MNTSSQSLTFALIDSRVHFLGRTAQQFTKADVKDFVEGDEDEAGFSKPQDRHGRRWDWLAGVSWQEADWARWERHVHGDELVMLLSGAMSLDLEYPDGRRSSLELPVGHGTIVPVGTWHRGIVREAGEVLTVTFGSPSQHRRVVTHNKL
jgi:mannose-6-phosphate isomerase-like protein (cupin superfamily)